jgi:hypothetical protein
MIIKERLYLPVTMIKDGKNIQIEPQKASVIITNKMEFKAYKNKILEMESFLKNDTKKEINNIGLAIGVQNFLYDNKLYAGVRTKSKATDKSQAGYLIAAGLFNTGYRLLKENDPRTSSLYQLTDPYYLDDLFKVTDQIKKNYVDIGSPVHKIIIDNCGIFQGNIKFNNGESQVSVILINKSIYFPRYEVGICKYIDISNYNFEDEVISDFGEDFYEDENYWLWVNEGKIYYRSYKSESIMMGVKKVASNKKSILIKNDYFEKLFKVKESYIPIASDELIDSDTTINRPFSSPARSLLELF